MRGAISRLEQEQVALQDRYAQENTRWDREQQSMALQNAHMEEQFRTLQQEKSALEARLEQKSDAWERERLAFQVQLNTLEDNLALQKARAGGGSVSTPDLALLKEKVRAEAEAEFNQRQAAWKQERQSLQEQLERLQAERRAVPEQAAAGDSELRQQMEQAQRDRQALEQKLAARELRAEQERSALEAEIEQLMERLLRLQSGSGA